MPPAAPNRPSRRTDLDVLRIIICFSVILAHALLIYAAEPRYHVKSASPWVVATVSYEFLRIATLVIFFVLAGWSAVASLRRRAWTRYVQDRQARVLLPLVAGIILLGPVIKWIELGQGRDLRVNGFRLVDPPTFGFLEFLPRYCGRLQLLTWSHLWFLAYLFLISLALLPVLRWAGLYRGQRRLLAVPAEPGAGLGQSRLFRAVLPGRGRHGRLARLRGAATGRGAPWLAVLAAIGLVVVVTARGIGGRPGRRRALRLGQHRRRGSASPAAIRRRRGRLLGWLGEATMPVYVLHHIPVLALGALLLPHRLGPPWLAVLAIITGATAVSLAAYRLLVQPWPWPRLLLGIEARPRAPGQAAGAASPAQRNGTISATARSKSPLSQAPPDMASSRPVRSSV